MAGQARFAVGLPQTVATDAGGLVRAFSRRAEELGFAGLWTMEGWFTRAPLLEGLHVLSHAAAVTERAGLGIAVVLLPRRNPALLAKELATMDVLSGGRLLVGVGLGHAEREASGAGVPAERLPLRLREGLAVLKAFWADGEASHEGRLWRFAGLAMEPKPLQRPHPPIWLGARVPAALRRAVRLGDGWMGSGSSTTAQFREQARVVAAACEELGRDPGSFAVGKRVYIAVEDDAAVGRRRMAEVLDPIYEERGFAERVAVFGPAERCAEAVSEVVGAGARYVLLNPAYDHLEQLEALARVAELA